MPSGCQGASDGGRLGPGCPEEGANEVEADVGVGPLRLLVVGILIDAFDFKRMLCLEVEC
jgi:hypothetical protein